MKKVAALLCFMVMCIQVLPIIELGKCLYDNTFIEEKLTVKDTIKKDTISLKNPVELFALTPSDDQLKPYFSFATLVPTHPTIGIENPPPNA